MFEHPFDCREQHSATPSSTRWVAWMPLLFVAAFLYWSVALGLGGLSLMAASTMSGEMVPCPAFAPSVVEPMPGQIVVTPIVVHLEESAEPEDVNDNSGAATPVGDSADSGDDGTGRLPGQNAN